jgi:hypothetical protein
LKNNWVEVISTSRQRLFSVSANINIPGMIHCMKSGTRWLHPNVNRGARPMDAVEPFDPQWFRSESAVRWLDDPAPSEKMLRRMQRELSDWQIQLVLTLRETRPRIGKKFPFQQLLATPISLEQASDFAIASYKARRFKDHPVIDMCCGMGGDLIALACRGDTVGVEFDPLLAELAAYNASLVCGKPVSVRQESCLQTPLDGEWLHIDPDRRPDAGRVVEVASYEPGWEQVLPLIDQTPGGVVKVAPAAELETSDTGWEREWVERGGQCRQQLVWWGRAANAPGRRVATMVDQEGNVMGQWQQQTTTTCRTVRSSLDDYLFEPSPAILAADLVDDLTTHLGLGRIAPGAVYVTGQRTDHPLLRAFRILDTLKLDRKKMIAFVRQRRPRTVEVKKRGVEPFDPNRFQRALKKYLGDGPPLVLIATRIGDRRLVIAAERVLEEGKES